MVHGFVLDFKKIQKLIPYKYPLKNQEDEDYYSIR
jgi:hypothetical protein